MTQNTTLTDHTIAVYATHDQALAALKMLNETGYDVKNLSIMGQDYATEERPVGFINTGDRMWSWGKLGAFWGMIWGLLLGSAMMFVPGVGYFMFAGWIVGALEGAVVVGGLGAIGGALVSLGVPKNSVIDYESALKAGKFIVVVHGDEAEVKRAKTSLAGTGTSRLDTYSSKELVGTH